MGLLSLPRKRGRSSSQENALKRRLKDTSSRVSEWCFVPKPPEKGVKQFYEFMNCREVIRLRRKAGLQSASLYKGLPKEFAEYFRRRCCPNVHRYHDRTTMGLHRFCAAENRFKLCQTDEERIWLKRLLVLNFAVWRFIGGTVLFASEVGFLNNWGELQKRKIQEVVARAFRENRIQELFTNAYKGPGAVRTELTGPNADRDSLLKILYNKGPKAVSWSQPDITFYTLVGKFQLIDKLWQESHRVVAAALPFAGQTEMRPVCEILAELPFFGASEDGRRVPGFFAKELVQDLMDTPVFPGGRRCVKDRYSYCPAGPGALEGLRLVYGMRSPIQKRDAVPLMQALLAEKERWKFSKNGDLDLHDIQFMLCELQKFLHRGLSMRDYAGPACVIGLPLNRDFIRHRLEDAIALDLIGTKTDECTKIAFQLAEWLGFRLSLPRDDCIRSGDYVILRKVKEPICMLELQDDGVLGPAKEHPTAFRVELPQYSQQLRSNDHAFLRAPNGAHLGPVSQAARQPRSGTGSHAEWFSAQVESQRFAEARELVVRKVGDPGGTQGEPLRLGDSVLLCSEAQTKDETSRRKALQVRMEPDMLVNELERELKEVVNLVLSSDFLTDELGNLRVKNPAKVRARCIGSKLPPRDLKIDRQAEADWTMASFELTGDWETDIASL